MACPQCGRAVANDDRFCGGCGTALARACRQCGRPVRAGMAYCTGCGAASGGPVPASAAGGGGGWAQATEDRRRVSVLFIDLVDFTPYAERADPEQVRALQHGFYTTARRVVGQHGGVVEKYIGDAVMALFGAPVATETDALRCVRAGLELQRVLGAVDHDRQLRFRVGVATGEALVDVAAARDGGQAIVAGDVVPTAARLESIAPPGGVLVCGQTHALTADAIRYAAQPPVTLRGHSEPTEVWLAQSAVRRQQAELEPDPTPLVEREHELGLLSGALHRAMRDRTPQLVTVFGQAGIGKSRLVRELRRRADELAGDRVAWHTARCPPFGEDVTYAGLTDVVKAQAGILDTDLAATARRRLEHAVREVVRGPDADRLAEALGPLVGLPGPDLPAGEAESAWRRFLIAIAARGPTVLVFEDLHWADESMRRFIELLAATARDVPLLVLGTARPELIERDASWAGTITGSLTITLPPLRNPGMTALYQHMLGKAAFAGQALRPLVELAGGNPLYAQEYVRMLVQRAAVPQPTLSPPLVGGDLPMPDSVHAVIANRVDLLEPADRSVLQAAAVVGMQFWPGAVAAALGQLGGERGAGDGLGASAGSVEQALRRLEQREFISEQLESSMAGQSEFRFRHVLVRDVCYQRLPRTERVARHARTADWLEAFAHQRDTDLAEVLAHHRWAAHEIARTLGSAHPHAPAARRALQLAARRAYALQALDTAANHTARALSLLADDPDEARETERLQLELLATELAFYQDSGGFLGSGGADSLRALAERLTALADRAGVAGAWSGPLPRPPATPAGVGRGAPAEATDLAIGPGVPWLTEPDDGEQVTASAARAWTLLGQAAYLQADRDAALAWLERAIVLFDPLPDTAEKIDAYAERARVHMINYECEPAMAAAGTAATIAERLGLVEKQATARITSATARYESGDRSGLAELHEITDQCRSDRLLALRRATRNLSHLVREEGDYHRAEELLAESLRLDQPGGHNVLTDQSADPMQAYFTGEFEALIDETGGPARSEWEERRDVRACLLALRDHPRADADAAAALASARATGFHRPLWQALAWAALCHALRRHPVEAAELLAELTGEWRKLPVIPGGAWVDKAAFAAALTGAEPAEALRLPLAELSWRTPWGEAALQTVTGAVALASGDPAAAGERHLAAAEIYRRIPIVTDRMLALTLAAAAFGQAGEPHRAEPALAEVRAFAQRRAAPVLRWLAEGQLGGGGR